MSNVAVFGEILEGVRYVERPGAYGFFFNAQRNLAIVKTSMGYFLPGGGAEEGESLEAALERELLEEIGYKLTAAYFITQASQYHWSEFYQQHFKKIGSFYAIEAIPTLKAGHADHTLIWTSRQEAMKILSQEFQRWALSQTP